MANCGAEKETLELKKKEEFVRSDNGKNDVTVECTRCKAVVLRPNAAKFSNSNQFSLPRMTNIKEQRGNTISCDMVTEWWAVGDKFDFDNIGYTNVEKSTGTKYLICADCEIGPLGYVDPDSHISYVALDRVTHHR